METLAWVLIYGGGLLGVIGLAIFKSAESLAVTAVTIGALSFIAGCFLIWLRSRSP
jgi:uncharacterized membrane protein HdeD (DUF308 family)